MSDGPLDPRQQADALIAELRHKAAQSAQDVLARATQEAGAILQGAREKAIRQLRRTRADLAQLKAEKLGEAMAAIEAARRLHAATLTRRQLAAAWPMLERALHRRWADAPSRQRWIAATVEAAQRRLAPAPWRVRVAAAASKEVEAEIQRALDARAITGATLVRDPGLQSGLVVECAGATLDTTVPALLVDRAAVEGALCAELDRGEKP